MFFFFFYKQDDLDIVRALIILGADTRIKDEEDKTALDYVTTEMINHDEINELFSMYDYGDKGYFYSHLIVFCNGVTSYVVIKGDWVL